LKNTIPIARSLWLAIAAAGICCAATDPPATAPSPIAPPATAPAATRPAPQRLFVATFDNDTGDEQYDPAAAGIGDVVAAMLTQQAKVQIVERMQLLAISKEQALGLKGLTGYQHTLRAGKILDAQRVLIGRVYLADGKLTVGVKILDLATSRVIAADQESCRPAELVEAAHQLTRRLARDLQLPLTEIDPKNIDPSPLAGLHFGKGLSHYYAGDMDAAIMQLMRTVDLDPDFTEAHYFCGLAYWKLKQPRDAIVEWNIFLDRAPNSPRAPAVQKLLAQAQELARAEHPVPRPADNAHRDNDSSNGPKP
jgi:TolB-like protein